MTHDLRKALEPFVALLGAIECTTNHPMQDADTWSCPDDAGIVTIGHLRALQKIHDDLPADPPSVERICPRCDRPLEIKHACWHCEDCAESFGAATRSAAKVDAGVRERTIRLLMGRLAGCSFPVITGPWHEEIASRMFDLVATAISHPVESVGKGSVRNSTCIDGSQANESANAELGGEG